MAANSGGTVIATTSIWSARVSAYYSRKKIMKTTNTSQGILDSSTSRVIIILKLLLWSAALIRYCDETRFHAEHYYLWILYKRVRRGVGGYLYAYYNIIIIHSITFYDDIHHAKCLYLFRPLINRTFGATFCWKFNRLRSFGHCIVLYSNIIIIS